MSQVAITATIKTNQTSFELIPEEVDSRSVSVHADIMDQQNKGHVNAETTSDASAQQAAQAAFAARIIAAQQNLAAGRNLPELALFSQQQQLIQHRILEEQIARSREFLLQQENNSGEGGKPAFGAIFHQVEAQRQAKEASEAIHHEKFKLEILKQKSRHDQSAVASPEVKRHLAEFVLKKKRQEASAVSMSNLKMVPTKDIFQRVSIRGVGPLALF